MSKDPTSPTPTQMSFLEDSPVSPSALLESKPQMLTPAISGRKCLGLSKSADRLGLLEKTLLESSNWAWTKYSLTWKTKATPQGRLIFQLARSAPRTSGKGSGLLHTPTATGNQMAPSMIARDKGSWGVKLWPTPRASSAMTDSGKSVHKRLEKVGYEAKLEQAVQMWPTPTAMTGGGGVAPSHKNGTHGWNIAAAVNDSQSPNPTRQWTVNHTDPNNGGSLNPQWVAWLMGYPTDYLKSVPWETQSSRKSQRK